MSEVSISMPNVIALRLSIAQPVRVINANRAIGSWHAKAHA